MALTATQLRQKNDQFIAKRVQEVLRPAVDRSIARYHHEHKTSTEMESGFFHLDMTDEERNLVADSLRADGFKVDILNLTWASGRKSETVLKISWAETV
jgi:hypothetical protein